jgi:uncharacterized membrane protein YuzA (DUF378 family)
MCLSCKNCKKKGSCHSLNLTSFLVFLGAFNWGLIGIGMLSGSSINFNLVNSVFGVWPEFEAVVYLIVGIASIKYILGSGCGNCKKGTCCTDCK